MSSAWWPAFIPGHPSACLATRACMGSPTLQTTANPRPEKTRGGRSARIGHMHVSRQRASQPRPAMLAGWTPCVTSRGQPTAAGLQGNACKHPQCGLVPNGHNRQLVPAQCRCQGEVLGQRSSLAMVHWAGNHTSTGHAAATCTCRHDPQHVPSSGWNGAPTLARCPGAMPVCT